MTLTAEGPTPANSELTSCPFCLEEIKLGARRCPHCQASLESTTENGDNTVYILDKGFLRFAKFAAAILAIFILAGIYLFGFDIKEASETANKANLEVQQALLEIEHEKDDLNDSRVEIQNMRTAIEQIAIEIAAERDDMRSRAQEVEKLLDEIRRFREEGSRIVIGLRTLGPHEAAIAASERTERGIDPARGKLWRVGEVLQFHFVDGTEDQKKFTRAAMDEWERYAELTFEEVSSPDATIRISFTRPGSWSAVGTDALGVRLDEPTMNSGYLGEPPYDDLDTATTLHDLGHALGLVHEYQNPATGDFFNKEELYKTMRRPPYNWSIQAIDEEALIKSTDYPGSRDFDNESVMNLPFPDNVFLPGMSFVQGEGLSDSDKAYIGTLYPRQGSEP